MHDMWEKFVQLGLGAGITCLMRASIGDILAAPGGREAMFSLFDECCAVATAAGFPPRPAFIEFDHRLIRTVGSPLKGSMLRDIERGSTTEGEHILGDMVARARSSAWRRRSSISPNARRGLRNRACDRSAESHLAQTTASLRSITSSTRSSSWPRRRIRPVAEITLYMPCLRASRGSFSIR